MKHPRLLLALTLLSTAFAPAGEWIDLFNGKDLKGWTARAGVEKLEAVDGEIHLLSKNNVWVVSDRSMKDFEVELEVMLPEDAAEMKLNTESYCEELETHLQAEFFAATEQSNYGTMKRCAETLEELSGLHSENVLISNVRTMLQPHTRDHYSVRVHVRIGVH